MSISSDRVDFNELQHLAATRRCYICDLFEKFFEIPEMQFEVGDYLSSHENKNIPCEFHGPIIDWINQEDKRRMEQDPRFRYDDMVDDVVFKRLPDTSPKIHSMDYKSRVRYTREILIRKLQSTPPQQFTTTLDYHWVNLQLASQWMDRCLAEHGTDCQNLGGGEAVCPDWVIDTEQEMLVRGQHGISFVALSYRWGNSGYSTLDNTSQQGGWEQRREPKGLSQSPLWQVPTIRDTVHVVKKVGERYLWIDSLCMNYGDGAHVTHQIQNMGRIYAAAKLVIVATDGDAKEGLRGLQGCSESRDLDTFFTLRDGREVVIRDLPDLSCRSNFDASEYFRRGWTFQEYFLARRRLVFGKRQIHWSCGRATWHEDLPDVNEFSAKKEMTLSRVPNIRKGIADFEELTGVICEYNDRNLTYPEDALPGIMGLLQALSLPFPGGFLFGIPKLYFESGLLWSCHFQYALLSRKIQYFLQQRERSARSHCSLPYSQLPSWSWVTWKGNSVQLGDRHESFTVVGSSETYSGNGGRWVTIPFIEWYSHDTPQSDKKRAIKSKWMTFTWDEAQADLLPNGWVAEKFNHATHVGLKLHVAIPWGVSGRVVYRHSKLPGIYYWRPIPVDDCAEFPSTSAAEQDPFISCNTKKGVFCTRHPGRCQDFIGDICLDVHKELLDSSGQTCGWLQLPSKDAGYEPPWPPRGHTWRNDDDGSSSEITEIPKIYIELVAICRRMFPVSRTDLKKTGGFIEYNEFYGVLYVEWKEGVAYRRGVGYVTKDGWEQHDLEDVDLILG